LTLVYVHIPVNVDVHIPMAAAHPNRSMMTDIDTAVMPIAVVGDDSSHSHPNSECHQWRDRVVDVRRGRIVYDWRVSRHVDHLRVCWHHLHDLVRDGHHLRHVRFNDDNVGDSDNLLRGGLKGASLEGFTPERLDRLHQLFGVIHKGLSELHGPV
jgi:hypothetical protein